MFLIQFISPCFTSNAINEQSDVTVDNIQIEYYPKTVYYVGETLDTTEMALLVTYTDGTEEEIENGFTCFPTRFNMLGTQTVTVDYLGKKCTFDVVVREDKNETPPYWGDVNGDKRVDVLDSNLIKRYSKGYEAFSDDQLCFGDVDLNGRVNSTDSVKILRYINGKESLDCFENAVITFTDFNKTTYGRGESLDETGLSVVITSSINPDIRYVLTEGITVSGFQKNVVGSQILTVSFRDYKTTKTVNVIDNSPPESQIEEIEMLEYRHTYYRGESLELSSLILVADYEDGSTRRFSNGFTCSPTGFYTPGTHTVTVDFKGNTCTFDVYVRERGSEPAPYWGDNTDDRKVNDDDAAFYSDYLKGIGTYSDELLCFADVDLTGDVNITDYTLMLKYIRGTSDLHTEDAVISFEGFEKTDYIEGEPLDTTNLSVVITNSADSNVRYEFTRGVTVSGYDPYTIGTQVLTFSYRDYEATKTVTVRDDVTSIAVDLENTKTQYYVGDVFQSTDATLIVNFADGTTEHINSGFEITEPVLNKVSQKRIKITYDSKTVSYTINIIHAPLSSISISTLPDKIEYEPGDELDSSGLSLHIEYENGYSQDIEEGFDISYDFRTSGRKQVTITYTEDNITKTASFYATVLQSTRIYAENTSAQAGSTVSVPIMIDNNKGIMAFRITVDYDQNAMTPVSVTAEDDLTGLFDNSIDTSEPGSFDIVWSGSENITRGGTIVTVTFNIKNNVLGQYSVGLSYNPEDTFNEDGDDVKLECEDFSISVYGSGGDVSTIIMSNFSVRCGETVDVPVNIFNNKGIEQTTVTIEYDKDLLIPKGINYGIANVVGENLLSADGTLEIQIGELSSSAGDGALFTIGFEAKYVEPQETFLAISSTDGTICIGPEVSILNGTAKIYSDDVSVDGSSVTVPIKINGNPGIMGFRLSFSYDNNIIAPVSVSRGAVLSSGSIENTIATSSVSSFDVIWNGNDDVTDNGVLFNITFNLLNTSAESFEINIEYNSDDTFNSEWKDVELNCEDIIWNKIQEITVTYDANGGTVEPENTTLIKGESLILPLPEKEEYTFSGWYSDSQLTSFVGEAGDSFIPTDDITLFAKWADTTIPTGTISSTNNLDSKQTVTLKLNDNIGVAGYYWGTKSNYLQNTYIAVDGAPKSKTIQFELNTPGKYYFVVKDTSGNVSSAVNKTFYKVTLNSNGGTVSPDTVFMMAGKTIVLPEPTRTDYTFVEWNTEENGNGMSINAESYKPTATTTIYAQWTETVISGQCGENATYTLNLVTGVLTVSGTGSLYTLSSANDQRWSSYRAKIKTVIVEEGIIQLPGADFSGCSYLTSVSLPNSLTKIGYSTFANCFALESLEIPSGVTSVGPSALSGCRNLKTVTVAEGNTSYKTIDDVLYTADGKQLVLYPCGKEADTLTVPDGVTSIQAYALRYCNNLSTVNMPESLTTIGKQAFLGCSNLTSITIPATVNSIGENAFGYTTAGGQKLEGFTINCYRNTAGLTYAVDNEFLYNIISIYVHFNANGGNCETDKKEVVYNSTYGELPDATRSGYMFKGWFTEENGGTEIDEETDVSITEDQTLYAQWEEIVLTKIAVKTKPNKLIYFVGDNLDQTGLTLTATYSDGSTKTISSSINCTPQVLITAGSQKITVKYGGKSTSFNLTVKVDTVTGIEISTLPTKQSYYVGDTLDSTGLTLTATYESGKTETVSEGFTCSPTSLNTAGNQEIEVTYSEQSTSFNVTVVEDTISKIAVKTKPTKLIYYVGDTLDPTGLKLTATYVSGKTETVTSGFTCTPTALNTVGTPKITVKYAGKSTSFNVTVKEDVVTAIEVSTEPAKVNYYIADTLDSTGLTLTATYESGKTETVTEGFTCSPASLNTAGNQVITVSFLDKTTSFNVTVVEDTISKIAVKTKPNKLIYYVGEVLDTTGLTLTATYASGKTETVTSGFTCTPTSLNTVGTQKITAKYASKSTSFNVTVKEDVITAVAVVSEPTKVNYYVGDTLDSAGLTLTATYESGKTETVTEGFTCSPTSLNTAGNQEIEVTYAEQSASFNVTVVEDTISKIAVKTKPTKLIYFKGDTLDPSGLILTATYASGKTEIVTSGFTCTPTLINTVGTQKITVKYAGKSTSFNVTVNELVAVPKLMPSEGSRLMIERRDLNGNSVVETNNHDVINGNELLPNGVNNAVTPDNIGYGSYAVYSEGANSPEYDSWYVYGIAEGTTVSELIGCFATDNNLYNISIYDESGLTTVQGTKAVGTGMIVRVTDIEGNFIEQFRVIIYGDIDGNGSVNKYDTEVFLNETGTRTWSSAQNRVDYKCRAADLDQNGSFNKYDYEWKLNEDGGTVGINQVSGRAYVKLGYTANWENTNTGNESDVLLFCSPITYYATFMADGNQVGAKVPFTVEDETISEPDVPAKEGYENGRWESYSIEANDITVNALYDEQCKHTDSDNDGKCDECGEAMVYTKDVIVDGEKVGEVTFTYGDTTIDNLPDVPEKTGYTGKWEYTITGSELDIHPKYTPITYYATFMADGKQVGDKIAFTVETTSITEPAVPVKDGYTGKWSAYSLTASNITINAVYEKIPAPSNPTAGAKLNVKSSAAVDYRSIVTVTATATGVPEGYVLAIFDGNTELARGDNKSVSYKVGEMKSGRTFTVKVIDVNGNVQKDSSGTELSKTCEVKVNSGFFKKLIAFFKGLFGLLPSIEIKP